MACSAAGSKGEAAGAHAQVSACGAWHRLRLHLVLAWLLQRGQWVGWTMFVLCCFSCAHEQLP